MAIGNDKTIPQNPAIMPPADTANITTSGCKELVFPYTLGPITLPSITGHIMHIIAVKRNNLVLITEETSSDKTATINPPNQGIIAEIPDKIPKIK